MSIKKQQLAKSAQRHKQRSVLKGLRLDAGFPRAVDFAETCGVKAPTYFAHENGTRTIKNKNLEMYASTLKIDAAELRRLLDTEVKNKELARVSAISTALSTVSRETGVAVSSDFQFYVFDQLQDKKHCTIELYVNKVRSLLASWSEHSGCLSELIKSRCDESYLTKTVSFSV